MSSCTSLVKPLLVITLFTNALLLFLPTSSLADIKTDKELVFFNWSDYFDPELMAKFEQQYQVKVRQPYFDDDDNRSDMLLETNSEGYDVVIVDTPNLSLYRKTGWLEKIDTAQIPNYRHIDHRWIDAAGDAGEYTVPFFWGTLGIAYRKDLVATPPDKWMDLFRPDEALKGKIGMHRNTVDLVGTTLKALGYSVNDTKTATLDLVEQLLQEQKPYVHTYDYLNLGDGSTIVTGEIVAGMFYSGDALMVMEFDENIEYVLPAEGSMIWIDHMVVMKSSKNKELAWQFINFVNDPENAAQLAEFVYSATPNLAAEKLLPDEFLQDPVIYPDINALSKSELNHPLPARIVKKRSRIVSRITE